MTLNTNFHRKQRKLTLIKEKWFTLDGMHARALGVGSVVGELFDHGLDSMANVFQLFPVVMALEMIKLDFYFMFVKSFLNFTLKRSEGRLVYFFSC